MKLDRRSFLQKLGIGMAGVGAMSAGLNPIKEVEARPKPTQTITQFYESPFVGDIRWIAENGLVKYGQVYDGRKWVLVSTIKQHHSLSDGS